MADKLGELEREELEPGIYYTPVFINKKTGNKGFVSGYEFFTTFKSHTTKIVRDYEARLKSQWSLEFCGERLRLKVPEDTGKYPMYRIEEGGTVLPWCPIAGPLYEDALRNTAQSVEKQENA